MHSGAKAAPGSYSADFSLRQDEAKEVEGMNTEQKCDNCGEELGLNPVRRGGKVYCCEACAFEAQRSMDCGGRSDSTMAPSIVEQAEK